MGFQSQPIESLKDLCAYVMIDGVTNVAVTAPFQVSAVSARIKEIKATGLYECAALYIQLFAGAAAPAAGDVPLSCYAVQKGAPGLNVTNEPSYFAYTPDITQQCAVDGLWVAVSEQPSTYVVPGTNLTNAVQPAVPVGGEPMDADVKIEIAYEPC